MAHMSPRQYTAWFMRLVKYYSGAHIILQALRHRKVQRYPLAALWRPFYTHHLEDTEASRILKCYLPSPAGPPKRCRITLRVRGMVLRSGGIRGLPVAIKQRCFLATSAYGIFRPSSSGSSCAHCRQVNSINWVSSCIPSGSSTVASQFFRPSHQTSCLYTLSRPGL